MFAFFFFKKNLSVFNLFNFKIAFCILFQANKDAARYPVAARVAELLIKGLVSSKLLSYLFKT